MSVYQLRLTVDLQIVEGNHKGEEDMNAKLIKKIEIIGVYISSTSTHLWCEILMI